MTYAEAYTKLENKGGVLKWGQIGTSVLVIRNPNYFPKNLIGEF